MSRLKSTNRIQSRAARKGRKFWCACDRAMVGEHGWCPVCRRIDNRKRLRMPAVVTVLLALMSSGCGEHCEGYFLISEMNKVCYGPYETRLDARTAKWKAEQSVREEFNEKGNVSIRWLDFEIVHGERTSGCDCYPRTLPPPPPTDDPGTGR